MDNYSQLSSRELLAECVANRSPSVWEEFVRRFQPLIASVVTRTAIRWNASSPALVDDLVQETYLKLCTDQFRRLREFESQHEDSIYGFIKAIAYTVTMDYFKVHNAAKRGAKLQSHQDFETSVKMEGRKSPIEDEILLQEIETFIEEVAEKQRDKLVFRLYYRQGFTTKTIADIPGIDLSEKGVESCLHRLTERLRKRVVGQPG